MAGIYIHIPFCRQRCHYCNFHFSTSLHYKNDFLNALLKEVALQKEYLQGQPVETIYFGGGTPSLLTTDEIQGILSAIRQHYFLSPDPEITLEANPDDISRQLLQGWKDAGINRLSIGVQSFFDNDLQWMNRAHSARQAREVLPEALEFFPNCTIDLIYGTPGLTDARWRQNVETAIALGIPHLSCYALTVEPQTPLEKMIREHKKEHTDPDQQSRQFLQGMQWLEKAGYEHYEISNFAKPGWRSRHNSAYWQNRTYLGLGPSAHSYNVTTRQWNIAHNKQYIDALQSGDLLFEKETLSPVQQHNEYIMTSLRTIEGLDTGNFSEEETAQLLKKCRRYLESGLLEMRENRLVLTKEGKLLADGIAAALFF